MLSRRQESLFPQTHDEDPERYPTPMQAPVRRKRKSESGAHTMIIVYYESAVQEIFEGIVRNISTARNNLRKGRMALKMKQMTSISDRVAVSMGAAEAVLSARLAMTRIPQARPADEKTVFDTIDQRLEAAQSLSEHGAHQFLREGDCTSEISGIKNRLSEVTELARQELERLAREEAEKAKAQEVESSSEPALGAISPDDEPKSLAQPVDRPDDDRAQPPDIENAVMVDIDPDR